MNKKQTDFVMKWWEHNCQPDGRSHMYKFQSSGHLMGFLDEFVKIDSEPDPKPEYVVRLDVRLDGKTIYTSPIKEASFDLATDYLEKMMRNSVAMKKANVLAYEKGKKLVIETLLQKYVYTVDKYTVEKL